MTHWTASVVAMLLAGFPSVASAQVNCEAIPHGPARTDCYLGLSQFYRGQSDLAAARARAIRRRVAMGTVKWSNPTNGYGFIQSDCGGQPDSGGKVWVAKSGRRQARQRDRRAL